MIPYGTPFAAHPGILAPLTAVGCYEITQLPSFGCARLCLLKSCGLIESLPMPDLDACEAAFSVVTSLGAISYRRS